MSDERRSRLRTPLLALGGLALFAGAGYGALTLLEPIARPGAVTESVPETPDVTEGPPAQPAPMRVAISGPPPDVVAQPVAWAPFRPDFTGPRVAIVLTDVGSNPADARAAIAALPPEIGLAFSPYPDESRALAATARADGHEVWVGVPMQPKSWPRVTPGANTLTVGAPAAENAKRLAWALDRVGPVAGVTSIMGSAFLERRAALDPLLADLKRRDLAFLDSRVSLRSAGLASAKASGVPALMNDRFLDESGDLGANLADLATAARLNRRAVGFARPSPASVAAIAAWSKTLEARGILLVPPRSLAR